MSFDGDSSRFVVLIIVEDDSKAVVGRSPDKCDGVDGWINKCESTEGIALPTSHFCLHLFTNCMYSSLIFASTFSLGIWVTLSGQSSKQ